jgi:hypothetical protein
MEGKAQLETDFVLFRGGAERFKVSFNELKKVRAANGVLTLEFAGGPAELELGAAAEKWARKILNPPSRADKLGIREGVTVRLAGGFDEEFSKEIAARKAVTVARGACDVLFLAAGKSGELARIVKLKTQLKKGGALWVVYPKGVTEIREIEVIQAGRAAGMKDVKVARFSATHTGLKFV